MFTGRTERHGHARVTIQDLGGDPYWVVNGLDIWTTTDPGQAPQLAKRRRGSGGGGPVLTAAEPGPGGPAAVARLGGGRAGPGAGLPCSAECGFRIEDLWRPRARRA